MPGWSSNGSTTSDARLCASDAVFGDDNACGYALSSGFEHVPDPMQFFAI
jgi:hypothetical protein